MKNKKRPAPAPRPLPKCPTGIQGLDEITGGGLPRGRPTRVCGGAGCGKTLLAAEFLIRGAVQFDEPGVLMAFEQTEAELTANLAGLGFKLAKLVRRKKIVLDCEHIERSETQESGDYDLEGLFVRLNQAIDTDVGVLIDQLAKVERKRIAIERQISGLRSDYESEAGELRRIAEQVGTSTLMLTRERAASGLLRQADVKAPRHPRTQRP